MTANFFVYSMKLGWELKHQQKWSTYTNRYLIRLNLTAFILNWRKIKIINILLWDCSNNTHYVALPNKLLLDKTSYIFTKKLSTNIWLFHRIWNRNSWTIKYLLSLSLLTTITDCLWWCSTKILASINLIHIWLTTVFGNIILSIYWGFALWTFCIIIECLLIGSV